MVDPPPYTLASEGPPPAPAPTITDLGHPLLNRIRALLFSRTDLLSDYDKLLTIFRITAAARVEAQDFSLESYAVRVQPPADLDALSFIGRIQNYLGIRELEPYAKIILIFEILKMIVGDNAILAAADPAPPPSNGARIGPPTA